jgi:hypothetical protein
MIQLNQNKLDRLKELLKKMDIPQIHKNPTDKDIPWLSRNLHIRNRKHPNYEEALKIIQELLKEIIKHTP